MKIFVVDTDKSSLFSIGKCLREVYPDAEIMLHCEPKTVLEAVSVMRPDQYISEVNLGNTDGIYLASKVKLLFPQMAITVLSNSCEYAIQAYRLHAKNYLVKPITPLMLKEYFCVV